jgi:hypothetical protein
MTMDNNPLIQAEGEKPAADLADFTKRIKFLIDHGKLVVTPEAIPTLLMVTAVCVRDNCYEEFVKRLEWMTNNNKDTVRLTPDGMPDCLCFGLEWLNTGPRWEGSDYLNEIKPGQKAWMYGGLIHREWEGKHEWTSHT